MAVLKFDDLPDENEAGGLNFDNLPNEAPAQYPPGSALESFGLGISAGQMPFADRLTSAMAAGAVAPFVPETYSELYKTAQDYSRSTREASPNAALAGNIAGIASSIPAAFSSVPKVTGALSGAGRVLKGVTDVAGKVATYSPFKGSGFAAGAGNLATKMAGSAAVAAPVTGAYFAGEAKPGEMGQEFGKGATMGAAVGAAIPAAGALLGGATAKFLQKAPTQLTAEQLREIGSQAFKKAEQEGGALKADLVENFISTISKKAPQTEAGKAIVGESAYSKMLERLQSLRGKPMTLEAAQEADSALGDLAYSTLDKFGKVTNEGRLYQNAQQSLRKMIEEAGPEELVNKGAFNTLKEARQFWSASLRMRDIERIVNNAQYFDQPATAIRTGFRQLLRNRDMLKGYSKEEIKAIEKAATTGVVTDFFRLAGSGLGPIITGSIGAGAAGPVGALAAAPAYAVREGAKAIAEKRQLARARGVTSTIQKSIETATGKTADDLLKIVENGGTISTKAIDALTKAEKKDLISRAMKLPAEQARKILNIDKKKVSSNTTGINRLPNSDKFDLPGKVTKEIMDKYSNIEAVPLNMARSGQTKMYWDDFNSGKHDLPLINGYEDMPIAVRLRNGEYIIKDGHHRTVLAINSGNTEMKMYVVDAAKYDPVNAGRPVTPPKPIDKKEIDDLLNELLGDK